MQNVEARANFGIWICTHQSQAWLPVPDKDRRQKNDFIFAINYRLQWIGAFEFCLHLLMHLPNMQNTAGLR